MVYDRVEDINGGSGPVRKSLILTDEIPYKESSDPCDVGCLCFFFEKLPPLKLPISESRWRRRKGKKCSSLYMG